MIYYYHGKVDAMTVELGSELRRVAARDSMARCALGGQNFGLQDSSK